MHSAPWAQDEEHRPGHRPACECGCSCKTDMQEWMARQLAQFRRRNIQVHIVGHVPPTAGNFFERCYDAYTELVVRFQDTIVGQHFGHMNIDAFFVQESSIVAPKTVSKAPTRAEDLKRIECDLKHDYGTLPGPSRTDMDYYSAFHLAPSVVPTYFPSVRVWTYNTTPAHGNRPWAASSHVDDFDYNDTAALDGLLFGDELEDEGDDDVYITGGRRSHRRPHRKQRRRHRKLPRYASADSPIRSNTFLTPLGFSQWTLDIVAANALNERVRERKGADAAAKLNVEYELEYATYTEDTLWHEYMHELDAHPSERRHQRPEDHHVPIPRKLLDKHLKHASLKSPFRWSHVDKRYELAKQLRNVSAYAVPDMTLRSEMDVARRLVLDSDFWTLYVHWLYTSSIQTSADGDED